MKTTLEVPDELYRRVKSQAALNRRKIKDYVAEGLRLALEAEASAEIKNTGPLSVFDEVRRQPLHRPEEVRAWTDAANEDRKTEWRSEG